MKKNILAMALICFAHSAYASSQLPRELQDMIAEAEEQIDTVLSHADFNGMVQIMVSLDRPIGILNTYGIRMHETTSEGTLIPLTNEKLRQNINKKLTITFFDGEQRDLFDRCVTAAFMYIKVRDAVDVRLQQQLADAPIAQAEESLVVPAISASVIQPSVSGWPAYRRQQQANRDVQCLLQ